MLAACAATSALLKTMLGTTAPMPWENANNNRGMEIKGNGPCFSTIAPILKKRHPLLIPTFRERMFRSKYTYHPLCEFL